MEQSDQGKLQSIIKELDDLLMEGFNDFYKLNEVYAKRKQEHVSEKGSENAGVVEQQFVDRFHKAAGHKYHIWTNEKVLPVLRKLPEKHYQFHFINEKIEVMLRMEGVPNKISDLIVLARRSMEALERIILHLEDKQALAVRRDIARREHAADILYNISYSNHTREIKLNNIILTKTRFESENDRFFEYVYNKAGKLLGLEQIKQEIGTDTLNKTLPQIVRDLKFTDDLKAIFFPVIQKSKVMFVNPITKHYAVENDLPALNLTKLRRQSETGAGTSARKKRKKIQESVKKNKR